MISTMESTTHYLENREINPEITSKKQGSSKGTKDIGIKAIICFFNPSAYHIPVSPGGEHS
jgi:hypothetical protein